MNMYVYRYLFFCVMNCYAICCNRLKTQPFPSVHITNGIWIFWLFEKKNMITELLYDDVIFKFSSF